MSIKSITRFCVTGFALTAMLILPNTSYAKGLQAGCRGAACNGKDPQTMGCNADAKTLTSRTAYGLRVELRYSKRCNARWARTTNINNLYDPVPFAYLGSGNVTYRTAEDKSVWSYMWGYPIRACGGAFVTGTTVEFCTPAK